jgi:hypothetical protein
MSLPARWGGEYCFCGIDFPVFLPYRIGVDSLRRCIMTEGYILICDFCGVCVSWGLPEEETRQLAEGAGWRLDGSSALCPECAPGEVDLEDCGDVSWTD